MTAAIKYGRLDRFGAINAERFGGLMANALCCFRAGAAGEAGHPTPGELVRRSILPLTNLMSEDELLCFVSFFFEVLSWDARQMFIEAAERNQQAEEWPFLGVDPDPSNRVCRKHRPPPLTPAQKQRADAISFDDSPLETLAAAWAGASEQDQRDLVARATGRAAA